MQLEKGSKLYYIEYLDHACFDEPINVIRKKPFILWCCGYIINENKENDSYYAIISSGTRLRPQRQKRWEYVLKSAIIKKEVIYQVK